MRHQLIRELVVHYARQAGLQKMPRVFSRPDQFQAYMAKRGGLTRSERGHLRKGYEITVKRATTRCEVYVRPAAHQALSELDDTAAHAAVHMRWYGLHHGKLFDRRLKALMDGYTCPPQGHRLPEMFR
jgi:hypothetical protein